MPRQTILGAVLFPLLVAMLPEFPNAGIVASEKPKNGDIQQAVTRHLATDEVLQSRDVRVETQEGIVTLAGSVETSYERNRAARIAKTIKGVRSVVNRIDLKQNKARPDDELRRDVASALAADPVLESEEVTVGVADGRVTLTGNVDSFPEKLLCAQVAGDVRGVRGVTNELTIRPGPERTDEEIAAEIRRRLQADVWIDERLVRVEVKDGKVHLRGVVGSVGEKETAETDAWVSGVTEVEADQLSVDWERFDSMKRQRRPQGYTAAEAKRAIGDALRYDPRVNRFTIRVDVRAGTATLSGTVDNLAAKRAAEQDARRSIGVANVHNQLRVVPPAERTDEDIARDIRSALGRRQSLDNRAIGVDVSAGVATLSGTVATRLARLQAEETAERVKGVLEVKNEIAIEQRGKIPSDLEIKYSIENRMYWSSSLDDRDVTVIVQDGVVTFTGIVPNGAAFERATQLAIDAGAKKVHNRLLIRNVAVDD